MTAITFEADLLIWGCSYGFVAADSSAEPATATCERSQLERHLRLWDRPDILEGSMVAYSDEPYHAAPEW